MLNDPIPDTRNRIAYLMSLLFHPFVVAILTLLVVLRDVNWLEAITWTGLIAVILIAPPAGGILYFKRQQRYVYQRKTRGALYLLGWSGALVGLLVTFIFDGPQVLVACLATLLVWVPMQMTFNSYLTKVSIHVAVAVGCATALFALGTLDTVGLKIMALVVILVVTWSRIVTRNHTIMQVVLGVILGVVPVLLVFTQMV
jgi:hypothetical protein